VGLYNFGAAPWRRGVLGCEERKASVLSAPCAANAIHAGSTGHRREGWRLVVNGGKKTMDPHATFLVAVAVMPLA